MRDSSKRWVLALLSAAAGTVAVYAFGPVGTGIISSLAVGVVVFVMFLVGFKISNEKVKQTLLDVLSLFP